MDFTGGVSETILVKQMIENYKEKILWGFIKRSTYLNSLIATAIANFSVEKEPLLENGLVKGHAVNEIIFLKLF